MLKNYQEKYIIILTPPFLMEFIQNSKQVFQLLFHKSKGRITKYHISVMKGYSQLGDISMELVYLFLIGSSNLDKSKFQIV